MRSHNAYRALVNVLRLSAAEPWTQLAVIPDGTVKTDEIALNLGETIDWAISALSLPEHVVRLLRYIDSLLDAMSDRQELWSDQALISRSEWKVIRRESALALRLLGEDLGPPDLGWIKYVIS